MDGDTNPELYVSEDEKSLETCVQTIQELCRRNNWPVAMLALVDDKTGTVTATSTIHLQPDHIPTCLAVPQLGAAIFHSANIVTAGLQGEIGEEMVRAMVASTGQPESSGGYAEQKAPLTETYPEEGRP